LEFSEKRTTKARGSHQCYWCGESIQAGSSYRQWTTFGDGPPYRTRVHLECERAWQRGLVVEREYYSELVGFGDHRRGCLCERGHPARPCDCGHNCREEPSEAEAR
jgi:hypothetical protein